MECRDKARKSKYGKYAFGFGFCQVGKDREAKNWLGQLDSDKKFGKMIDCTSEYKDEKEEFERVGNKLSPSTYVAKMLLGPINKLYDQADEKTGKGYSPFKTPEYYEMPVYSNTSNVNPENLDANVPLNYANYAPSAPIEQVVPIEQTYPNAQMQQQFQQYAPQQYVPQQYAPQQYAPQQYAPQQYAPQQYAPSPYGQPQVPDAYGQYTVPLPYSQPAQPVYQNQAYYGQMPYQDQNNQSYGQ